MPRRTPRLPSYRLHRPSGQAVVTLSGRDHYLGPHGTEASKAEYDRIVGLWQANGRRPPDQAKVSLTVAELLLAYWKHAEGYYVKNGEPTSQQKLIRRALRPVRKLNGAHRVDEFGPLALKAVRRQLIEDGLSRGVINAHVDRIRAAFRWGVENELIPESVYNALRAVRSLPKGRSEAKDHPPVGPAPEGHVQAILPILRPAVRAMVELQLLAGMRPGEVVTFHPGNLDRVGDVWAYRVPEDVNKAEHHEKDRTVFIGPRAQVVLRPWLERFPDGYLFRPRGWSCVPKPRKTGRRVGPHYTTNSYYQAIRDACDKAGVPRFHPNQLRHAAATLIRRQFGLDAARTVLGHSDLKTSEIYAERDTARAREVMDEVG